MKPQFISVVAYIHNDADKIAPFIKTVMEQCKDFKQCEVIFVDDYSTDNSVEVIRKYYAENPADYIVSIVKLGKYHGMEVAMNAGRDLTIGDYVYEFDDIYIDYDGKVVIEAYEKCLEGYDVVSAKTNVPIKKTSKLFYNVFNSAIDADAKIGQESFRILSRRGINRVISMGVDIPYRKVIYQNSGLLTTQIQYKSTTGERPARITGKHERLDLALDSFIYFTGIIHRFSFVVTILFGILSLGSIIYALFTRGLGYHVGVGYVSTMIFMSLGFMGVFGLLTIVIKYLSVIIDITFKKQKYLISDIQKISSK